MKVLRTLLFWGICCLSAQAGSFTFVTPTGSSVAGRPVDARAVFNIMTSGDIVVFLQNLQDNPTDVGQLLSDLSFTLGGGGSLSGASLFRSSGREITVASNGTFTLGSTVPAGWTFSGSTTTATLDVLGAGGAGPEHLIIGEPGPFGRGIYSNANGSIAGNKPHNPFLYTTVSFVITGPGIIRSTTITSATFSFGTTPGVTVEGTEVVPEPSAELLLGLGTLAFVGLATASRKLIST